ncbi:GDSL esterase/lipase [Canna indica]|uniref:GDSL esterase/lipase n=1 Tax=Canna indica TaxID=4628 RepID=A0AAQ3KR92_9LILI|nr:GDSL esterase/lipase [Canna indica]
MAPNPIILLVVLFLLPLSSSSLPPPHPIPAIIVFGDSTVDSGNNNYLVTLLKANFPPYGRDFPGGRPTGRFCNGRLVTDFISEALGLPPTVPPYLDPAYSIQDFAAGVSFASAGTGLDIATSQPFAVIPLMQEAELFKEYTVQLARDLGEEKARYIISEAAYIVSVGTNDFIENYFSMTTDRRKQFSLEEFGDYIIGVAAKFLTEIYSLGARKIAFSGLTPFGCLPVVRAANLLNNRECVEEFNEAAREFNVKLEEMIDRLDASLPGIKLRYTAVYDFLLYAIQHPRLYGFENAVEACCGTGEFEVGFLCNKWNPYTCEDADRHLFWDAVHPSEKLNAWLANLTLNTSLAEFL